MKKGLIIMLVLVATVAHGDDSLTISRADGRGKVSDVISITHQDFEKLRTNVERIVAALGTNDYWNDFGPGASHESAQIVLGEKRYTINSWYPLYSKNPNVAVSETEGLVSVVGRTEKMRIENQNSERYRTLVSIFQEGEKRYPQPAR